MQGGRGSKKKFYIKSRYNPQLGVYYVAMGQMSATEAKKHERAIYGENTMLPYDTEQEYQKACLEHGIKH